MANSVIAEAAVARAAETRWNLAARLEAEERYALLPGRWRRTWGDADTDDNIAARHAALLWRLPR